MTKMESSELWKGGIAYISTVLLCMLGVYVVRNWILDLTSCMIGVILTVMACIFLGLIKWEEGGIMKGMKGTKYFIIFLIFLFVMFWGIYDTFKLYPDILWWAVPIIVAVSLTFFLYLMWMKE